LARGQRFIIQYPLGAVPEPPELYEPKRLGLKQSKIRNPKSKMIRLGTRGDRPRFIAKCRGLQIAKWEAPAVDVLGLIRGQRFIIQYPLEVIPLTPEFNEPKLWGRGSLQFSRAKQLIHGETAHSWGPTQNEQYTSEASASPRRTHTVRLHTYYVMHILTKSRHLLHEPRRF